MALSYSLQNGNGATQNFSVPFSYIDRSHVHVYVGGVETSAFTWVNSSTIQITPAPPAGTGNVELRRVTPRDAALVDFQNGSVLFDTDLDTASLQTLFISQEYFEQATNLFPTGHTLDSHSDATIGASVAKGTMRAYDNNSKWNAITAPADGAVLIGDTADTKGVRWLPKGTDGNFLQVLDASAGKVSWVSGFKNLYTTIGDILYASAAGVATRLGIGTAGQVLVARPSSTPPLVWETIGFTTGDVKLSIRTTADTGWVLMNDTTIGDASSGATGRANADTVDLFTLLWNNTANADCAVSGGRGGSAAVDYAAHKTITLPKALGRALACYGSGSGLTARALAKALGSEDAIVVQHNHGITDPGHSHQERGGNNIPLYVDNSTALGNIRSIVDSTGSGSPVQALTTASTTTGLTVNNAGSSGVDANMPPTLFLNVMIKL